MVKEGGGSSVSKPTINKWLLEAIRKVKHQKQRPNLERIFNAVRHHNLSQEVVADQLESAVKAGVIMRTFTKGICSYKDPAMITSKKVLKVGKQTDLTKVIIRCLKQLDLNGSSFKSLENFMKQNFALEADENVDFTRQIRLSLKKAVNKGALVKDGQLYKVGCSGSSGESDSASGSSVTNNSGMAVEDDTGASVKDAACVNKTKVCFEIYTVLNAFAFFSF